MSDETTRTETSAAPDAGVHEAGVSHAPPDAGVPERAGVPGQEAGAASRRQRRILIGLLAVVVLAVLVVLVAQLFTGCWVDVGNEMGRQPNVGYVEPPRGSAPDEAVPFQGPDVMPGLGSPANPVTRTAESVERGGRSYGTFCLPCHGEVAPGGQPGMVGMLFAPPVPNLADRIDSLIDGDVFLAVTKGFGRMPALASRLSVEERWHLVNYLGAQGDGGPAPAGDSAILRGAHLFGVQCASCHGPSGQGALGSSLHPSSLMAEASLDEIKSLLRAGRPGLGMPSFGGRLSEQDLDDLAVLLKQLQAQGPSALEDPTSRLRETTTTVPDTTVTTGTGRTGTTLPATTTTTVPGTTTTTSGGGVAARALGQKVYTANCLGCHGVDGSGGLGPRLKPSPFVAGSSDDVVRGVIENGVAGTAMPNWGGRLSADEISALVDLLRIWQEPSPSGATATGGPPETVPFSHKAHVAKGVTCLFCHSSAARGPAADLPALELCVGCHRWISTQTPDTQAVLDAFDEGRVVSWARVYNLPDFVFFSHQPHVVVAKVDCATCHGDVGSMTLAKRAVRHTMGFCLGCHKQQADNQRLIDCQICHK